MFLSPQKIKFEVLKSLREVDNRLCADCDDTLFNESKNVYARLLPQPSGWICQNCMLSYRRVLSPKIPCKVKSVQDEWTSDDYTLLMKCGSNVKSNRHWERYFPKESSWKIVKISSQSSNDDRDKWIKAKYFNGVFTIPNDIDTKREEFPGLAVIPRQETILPTRLVDYYLVIGFGRFQEYTGKLSSTKFAPEDVIIQPSILSSYPPKNSLKDMEIPDMLCNMVFPLGMKLSSDERQPLNFPIVMTDVYGCRIYGSVLIIYEPLDPMTVDDIIIRIETEKPKKMFNSTSTVYVPKAVVLLSHYPFFHLFSTALKQFYRISLVASPLPLERVITNFVHEVPLPPQGRVEVVIGIADVMFQLRRPPPNQLPMVDFSYRPLFMCISIDNVLTIFRCMILEVSVCFTSSQLSILTAVQEAFLSFLFPFSWQGIYIPVIESSMLNILDAPVPFIVGVPLVLMQTINFKDRPSGVLYVDVDGDKLSFGDSDQLQVSTFNQMVPQLPNKPAVKLREKLNEFGAVVYRSSTDLLATADRAFPRKGHLLPIPSGIYFDNGIVRQRPLSSKADKALLQIPVLCTYAFSKILDESVAVDEDMKQSRLSSPPSAAAYQPDTIFDPKNNFAWNDKFDAREIRGAFLRFFVACLSDYAEIIAKSSSGGLQASMLESKRVTSVRVDSGYQPSLASYDTDATISKEDEPFARHLSVQILV